MITTKIPKQRLWHSVFLFLVICIAAIMSTSVYAYDGWIDVHFHVVGDKGKRAGFAKIADHLIDILDKYHVSKAIIMSPPRPFQSYDIEELLAIQEKYPSRIAIMGGGGTLNPMIQKYGHSNHVPMEVMNKFKARAEQILALGAKGFGEITAHHVSLNPHHGYESVPADNPLLLLLADIAAKHDVPIDFHFDPIPEDVDKPADLTSPKDPPVFKENVKGFERLLAHNPKAKIVWAHAGSDPVGFYTPQLVRRLMKKYPNLYCSIRSIYKRNHPFWNPRTGINSEWMALVREFPDRFVMGTDSFIVTDDYTGPAGPRIFSVNTYIQRVAANKVLDAMGPELAREVGHDNPVRIYHLE